jgi:predicted ATPase
MTPLTLNRLERPQVEAGVSIVAEALALVEQTGVRWYEAETYRIKGALLLHQADPDAAQAEVCFQQVLALARHQEAKSWERCAATSLAPVAGPRQAPGRLRLAGAGVRVVHRYTSSIESRVGFWYDRTWPERLR